MNNNPTIYISVDIGGSHISATIVNLNDNSILHDSYYESSIDSKKPASKTLNKWCNLIKKTIIKCPKKSKIKIGITLRSLLSAS